MLPVRPDASFRKKNINNLLDSAIDLDFVICIVCVGYLLYFCQMDFLALNCIYIA